MRPRTRCAQPTANGNDGSRASFEEPASNADGGEGRSPRVVLVSEGRAEQGHESIPEELVDRAFIAVHLGERQLEESVQEHVHRFGPDPRGQRRRFHEVAEEHTHLLALPSSALAVVRILSAMCRGV